MPDMEERNYERGVNIHRLNLHIPLLIVFTPLSFIGLVTFTIYVFTHWSAFVGQSASIVSWCLFFGALCLYTLLAWLASKAIRALIDALMALGHGAVNIYRSFSEARGQAARNQLLHTDGNYVVYLENGQVRVQTVIQEKVTYSIRQQEQHQEMLAGPDEMEQLPAPVQTFQQLLMSGAIQSAIEQGKMVLGYSSGALRFGSWLDLYSCGIGGVSGSGKTTTVRFLLFQALLAGARLLMVDPHIGEPEESLAAQFQVFKSAHLFAPCDDNPNAVLKRVRWLSKELARRKSTGEKTPFIIFVIDEFNAVMRVTQLRDEMSTLLVSIAQEGRKFGIFAMLIGQRWSHQDIGGADIRTSLASTLAHRFTDEEQAKKLVGSRNGPRCLDLPQGHYLFRDTQGTLSEMVTPFTIVEDGLYIQRLLDGETSHEKRADYTETSTKIARNHYAALPAPAPDYLLGNQLESTENVARNEQDTEPLAAQDAALLEKMQRVLKLQADGKQKPEIMKVIWNVSPGSSQAYEQANTEYRQVMQLAYERLGA